MLRQYQLFTHNKTIFLVINLHGRDVNQKAPKKVRQILCSRIMYLFCIKPFSSLENQTQNNSYDSRSSGKWFLAPNTSKETGKVFPMSYKNLGEKMSEQTTDSKATTRTVQIPCTLLLESEFLKPEKAGSKVSGNETERTFEVTDQSVNKKFTEEIFENSHNDGSNNILWKHVAIVMDRILFFISCFATLITFASFIQITKGN